jgi:hypothetical protein
MSDRSEQSTARGGLSSILEELPLDRLKEESQNAISALSKRALESAGERITGATGKLTDLANGEGVTGKAKKEGAKALAKGESPVKGALEGGLSGLKDKAMEALGGGGSKGGGGRATKATNILEEIDVGVPVDVAYNTWTEFQEYSNFMKKVDGVDQKDDVKVDFKAQVFWSHRKWEATILEQVPDERIIWRSQGQKGHVDGAVSFHELAPNLTRIIVVLEYYPQGLFERTGNLWRAQGRRARLELKHFARHVMINVAQNPDDVEGWRGEIHDKKVERSHEDVVEEEEQEQSGEESEYEDEGGEEQESDTEYDEDDEADDEGEPEAEYDDEYEQGEEEPEGDDEAEDDEYEDAEEEPEAEYDEEDEAEGDEEEPEAEYDEEDEAEGDEEEPEAEYDEEDDEEDEDEGEPEEEPAPRPARRKRSR